VIDVREIGELATMPGKEELFSKLLFLINSPAQRLATVINATGRDLAVVINQGVEQGKFAGPAAVAAPATPVAEAPAVEEAKAETPAAETPATEAPAAEAAAHVEESAAGEQPSGAAQPENSTASQGGEAATTDPVEG
jgi:large subunit ribosomal protein L10